MVTVVPTVLGMFLIGLLVGRRRFPHNPAEHEPLIRRTATICLTTGFTAHGNRCAFVPALAGPRLGLVYAETFTLINNRTGPAAGTKPFAAAGRMALTNYRSQSLICTLIFASYAGGMVDSVSPLGLLGVALAIFLPTRRQHDLGDVLSIRADGMVVADDHVRDAATNAACGNVTIVT